VWGKRLKEHEKLRLKKHVVKRGTPEKTGPGPKQHTEGEPGAQRKRISERGTRGGGDAEKNESGNGKKRRAKEGKWALASSPWRRKKS